MGSTDDDLTPQGPEAWRDDDTSSLRRRRLRRRLRSATPPPTKAGLVRFLSVPLVSFALVVVVTHHVLLPLWGAFDGVGGAGVAAFVLTTTTRMSLPPETARRRPDGSFAGGSQHHHQAQQQQQLRQRRRRQRRRQTPTALHAGSSDDGGEAYEERLQRSAAATATSTTTSATTTTLTARNATSTGATSGGLLLSPYHLLHPEAFAGLPAPLEGAVPLLDALNLMRDGLISLLDRDGTLSPSSSAAAVVRIEQAISHDVDPLCWLQAQMDRNPFPLRAPADGGGDGDDARPTFYFATADGTTEAAAYGSSQTHRGPLHRPAAAAGPPGSGLPLLSRLPRRARMYGGQRFDTESVPSVEWAAFGTGFWMLPAVEVRKERPTPTAPHDGTTGGTATDGRPPRKDNDTLTLAVHLVADPDGGDHHRADGTRTSDGRFSASARHVLSILQSLTDACTTAIPPTTLPPVLSRTSNYEQQQQRLPPATEAPAVQGVTRQARGQPASSPVDGQELYERGVTAALQAFAPTARRPVAAPGPMPPSGAATTPILGTGSAPPLEKVVLARRLDLQFAQAALGNVRALDILRKWKFASQPGGHLFYLSPHGSSGEYEFFGCTPERLFQVRTTPTAWPCNGGSAGGGDSVGRPTTTTVVSEALAGTRPRGSTPEADQELSRELFASAKDQAENQITGRFIMEAFGGMERRGWVRLDGAAGNDGPTEDDERDSASGETSKPLTGTTQGGYFVRRLRHLQHICQRFQCELSDSSHANDAIQYLLAALHPTPAVGGYPREAAMDFIRQHEGVGFDRGFYAGPVGFVGRNEAELVVAIRSGLVSRGNQQEDGPTDPSTSPIASRPKLSVYAGAGIVPGSTAQGEWAETSYKLAVVSSIFPQSPITLQGAQTPNSAWSTAFVEELVRNGVTQFYICPGSRSTPLVAAVARAVRSNVGIVHALSIHDERGAGFRAVGYARGVGRPAAVITSSGTAVANLYPAIVEAGMDAVPLLIVTADRPYESRDTGANQAIDQVKAYSQSYLRWFRDIMPPNDDVPVSVALADASHGVRISRDLQGPVHLNVQFRENLAPDAGQIRNDDRVGSFTRFDTVRFTDAAGFHRWSLGGRQWIAPSSSHPGVSFQSTVEILRLILQSRRGIIVVGNIRKPTGENQQDQSHTIQQLSAFAQSIGFPIFAGVQSGSLRFESSAVIPFAEHILRCPEVQNNLKPDLVLQFGAPLISTEVHKIIKQTMSEQSLHHVLVHPHHPSERADPEFTVSHKVNADVGCFLRQMVQLINSQKPEMIGSKLAPLVTLGRILQPEMLGIVEQVVMDMKETDTHFTEITEPEIVLSLSKMFTSDASPETSLFLSNSMPVRDAEAFLYPTHVGISEKAKSGLKDTGVNRGASGIDGVIASAAGYADSTGRPTSLLIGDVAALHDINSLHALTSGISAKESQAQKFHPLTTIVLNNDGGGIFSFLPIAKYGSDVGFEEFFGTPTNSFSFESGANAFGISFQKVENIDSFVAAYTETLYAKEPSMIEVIVASRDKNVAVHKEITGRVNRFLSSVLSGDNSISTASEILPLKHRRAGTHGEEIELGSKTLVLLHGWMGDSSEWDDVEGQLLQSLPSEWSIISLDLPGHGSASLRMSSDIKSIINALGLSDANDYSAIHGFTLDEMARTVCRTLEEFGVKSIDALAGYSLGGRVALAMKRLSMMPSEVDVLARCNIVRDETKMILISAYPGEISGSRNRSASELKADKTKRTAKDDRLAREMDAISNRAALITASPERARTLWSDFLSRWYDVPLWGSIRKEPTLYKRMIAKRAETLSLRGHDLAAVLRQCSPPRCSNEDWRGAVAGKTIYLVGELDRKYCDLGREWYDVEPSLGYQEVPGKGHALLVEAAIEVAEATSAFLLRDEDERMPFGQTNTKIWDTRFIPAVKRQGFATQIQRIDTQFTGSIGSLDFEAFRIDLAAKKGQNEGVFGVGWGAEARARENDSMKKRSGFVIQLTSKDGLRVGIGEASPLAGVHFESMEDVGGQLEQIACQLSDLDPHVVPFFDATQILAMDGAVAKYLDSLCRVLEIELILASVRSGLEMAILSLASQIVRSPIHEALVDHSPQAYSISEIRSLLPLNGLVTRNPKSHQLGTNFVEGKPSYSSWKVKIAHQSAAIDVDTIKSFLQSNLGEFKIRADANRGFNDESLYIEFAHTLEVCDSRIMDRLEYIEEPLCKRLARGESWSLEHQVQALERCFNKTSIPYALDESLFDLMKMHMNSFDDVAETLRQVFGGNPRGCAALVLKPSLLGLEASLRLARLARTELGIGAVFTSTFDSGVGLAFASFMGSLSDATPGKSYVRQYPHGLSTFDATTNDCLSPSFGSYVNDKGMLNVCSLSRAFYGLALDEIQSLSPASLPPALPVLEKVSIPSAEGSEILSVNTAPDEDKMRNFFLDDFEASTSTSNSGRDVVLVASLPLPFSADIACARFTDLPQQPRWSPWLASVAYLGAGSETEWTLRIRGVSFRWRAKSELLDDPYKGIRWKSTSGVKNTGVVEFIGTKSAATGATKPETCVMKVRMAFVTPRLLSSLFRGTIVEDFLRNKIMKWSLEMFRDVVKGDLALEEGNVELGDALFGAVEGKASAIEATLASSSSASSTPSLPLFDDDGVAF